MHPTEIEREFKTLFITSTAFSKGGNIPARYTGDGEDISPPIEIGEIPENVKSLVLIVDDPDAPKGTWLHWLVWNIPVTHHIKKNYKPGIEGKNDFNKLSYGGPYPPSGTHRYFFRVYGLDDLLSLQTGSSRSDLEQAMRDHIVAYGELVGLYKKQGKPVRKVSSFVD